MMIIPALIVAVIFGILGAAMTLVLGFGWRTALVAYWISGNLGVLAVLAPSLARAGSDSPRPATKRLRYLRPAWPMAWIACGLLMIVWHEFQPHIAPSLLAPAEVSTLAAVHDASGAAALDADTATARDGSLMALGTWLLQLPLWLMGLAVYLYGVSRLISASANRSAVSDES